MMECNSEIAMIIVVASGLKVFDATCPLVTKVHVEVGKMRNQAREVVMIGHMGHPEVEGTMGQSEGGMVLVVGSQNSSNSRRLKEVAVARSLSKPAVRCPECRRGNDWKTPGQRQQILVARDQMVRPGQLPGSHHV
jgi:4-hydroxy-3-methylbut-2-enyl diphosphate reductase IspH